MNLYILKPNWTPPLINDIEVYAFSAENAVNKYLIDRKIKFTNIKYDENPNGAWVETTNGNEKSKYKVNIKK